jgi:hypothetical protein
MFFGLSTTDFAALSAPVKIFLSLAHGFHNSVPIVRSSQQDKEYHFQNWVERRINTAGLKFEKLGRHGYPDFVLSEHPSGYEVKGLAVPGRIADFDCNSQLPLALQDGRTVYYIFGRYPNSTSLEFPVHDLVLCSASLLNAETVNNNTNQSFRGAGSYGDILIRDRRMYVSPTPYALMPDTVGHATLVVERDSVTIPTQLCKVDQFERIESAEIVTGYSFDFASNKLSSKHAPNASAGTKHLFDLYRIREYCKPSATTSDKEK